jgi:competence protein ComEC
MGMYHYENRSRNYGISENASSTKKSTKNAKISYSTLLIFFLSLLISGCSSPKVNSDVAETLTVNTKDFEIFRNESVNLEIVLDAKSRFSLEDIACNSSNESVAVVVNNKVFGLSVGIANISCNVGDLVSNLIKATIKEAKTASGENEPEPEKPLTPTVPTKPTTPIVPTKPSSPTTPLIPGSLMYVNFIDVGQGDSILIQTPNGKNILIDAGSSSFQTSIANCLKSKGISKIDLLIATHPHADHIGGMSYIVENFDIGLIYMPKATTTTKTFETLLTTIKNKGLVINSAKAGTIIDIDNALVIRILAPVSSGYSDLNQYSAVIKITYKNNSFLFMGDAGESSELEILNSGSNIITDVLKIGHHGSSTSTSQSFLSATSSRYAVISVGEGNTYGHPTDQTLTRINAEGIRIFRTVISGTIVLSSDGQNIYSE